MKSKKSNKSNKSNKRLLVLIILALTLVFAKFSYADVMYLKNGNKLEGTPEYTSKGIWMQGMLFQEGEISKIEKTNPSANSENKSWVDKTSSYLSNMFGGKSKETAVKKPAAAACQRNAANSMPQMNAQSQANPLNGLLNLMGGMTQGQQGGMQNMLGGAQNNNGGGIADIMKQATMLQQQAQMQQQRMMREMQEAYGEDMPPEMIQGYGSGSSSSSSYGGNASSTKKEAQEYLKNLKQYYKDAAGGDSGSSNNYDSGYDSGYDSDSYSSGSSYGSSGGSKPGAFKKNNIGRKPSIGPQ